MRGNYVRVAQKIRRVKQTGVVGFAVLATILLSGLLVGLAQAQSGSGVVISELQTGGTNASAEYIKLSNNTLGIVDVKDWKVQYRSSAGSTWTTRAVLTGVINPLETLLVASDAYGSPGVYLKLTPGMAQAGGHMQVINAAGVVQDLVGWGTAQAAEQAAAPAPAAGQFIRRKQPAQAYTDSDNNAADFVIVGVASQPSTVQPTPQATAQQSRSVALTDADDESPTTLQAGVPLELSEILPNPGSPQTDADDEYIELFNPTGQKVSLSGYAVQAGTTSSRTYTFESQSIEANGYFVAFSRDTNLALANTTGLVRLLGPDGAVIDESAAYETAKDNVSWAVLGGMWQWTGQPTPGEANVAVAIGSAKTSQSKSTAAKSTKSTKSGTTRSSVAGASTKKPAAPKTAAAETVSDKTEDSQPFIHPLVLAVVGTGAVAYAVYEYRHDMANRIAQFRRYRKNRALNRAKVPGRGSL